MDQLATRPILTILLLTLFLGSSYCQRNRQIFEVTPKDQMVFSNESLTLQWKTELPDDVITNCSWTYSSGNGWTEFLAFDNTKKIRINSSGWNHGWQFTNKSFPCQGGIMRSHVNMSFEKTYRMVMTYGNGYYRSKSRVAQVLVIACSKPIGYKNDHVHRLVKENNISKVMYSCNNNVSAVICDEENAKWEGELDDCPNDEIFTLSNVSTTLWTGREKTLLAILMIVCILVFMLIILIILYKKGIIKLSICHKEIETQLHESDDDRRKNIPLLNKDESDDNTGSTADGRSDDNEHIPIKDSLPLFLNKSTSIRVKADSTDSYETQVSGHPLPRITCREACKFTNMSMATEKIDKRKLKVTLTFKDLALEDSCEVKLEAKNKIGKANHRLEIIVLCCPSFATALQCSYTPEDNHACFSTTVKGFPKPDIKWTVNGKEWNHGIELKEMTNNVFETKITLHPVPSEGVKLIEVTATNEHGQNSQRIEPKKPVFNEPLPKESEVDYDEHIQWKVIVKAIPQPYLRFLKGNNELKSFNRIQVTQTQKEDMTEINMSINSCDFTDKGCYQIIVGNISGKCDTDTFLTVNGTKPEFVKKPENLCLVKGDKGEVNVEAIGNPTPTIQWKYATNFQKGLSTTKIEQRPNISSFVISSASVKHNGEYSAEAVNAVGKISMPFVVQVFETHEVMVKRTNFTKQIVQEGEDARFSVVVQGMPTFTFQWFFNDNLISDSSSEKFDVQAHTDKFMKTTLTLTIKQCAAEDNGKVHIEICDNASTPKTTKYETEVQVIGKNHNV